MNVPQDTLNGWRRALDTLRGTLNALRVELNAGRRTQAQDALSEADNAARLLGLSMEDAGAELPAYREPRPTVPLQLMDTPANRRYAAKLREAWEAGLAVDRERYGESIGTDGCAQMVEMLLADVEQECFGAVGAGRE